MKDTALTFGQGLALVKKLGGADTVERILCGKIEVSLKVVGATALALWRTLTTHIYKSTDETRRVLTAAAMRLDDNAVACLSRAAAPSQSEVAVRFGRGRVQDLGFTRDTPWPDILAAIIVAGHKLCLPSDAVTIRINYPNQAMNTTVYLAMEPLKGSDKDPDILCCDSRTHGLWLSGAWSDAAAVGDLESEFFYRM